MPGDDDIIDDIEDGPEEGQENIEQSVEKDDALEIDSKTESDRDSASVSYTHLTLPTKRIV